MRGYKFIVKAICDFTDNDGIAHKKGDPVLLRYPNGDLYACHTKREAQAFTKWFSGHEKVIFEFVNIEKLTEDDMHVRFWSEQVVKNQFYKDKPILRWNVES